MFVAGSEPVAADADDYILYDTDDGSLYFDADGSGTDVAAVKIATINVTATLDAADFLVI